MDDTLKGCIDHLWDNLICANDCCDCKYHGCRWCNTPQGLLEDSDYEWAKAIIMEVDDEKEN